MYKKKIFCFLMFLVVIMQVYAAKTNVKPTKGNFSTSSRSGYQFTLDKNITPGTPFYIDISCSDFSSVDLGQQAGFITSQLLIARPSVRTYKFNSFQSIQLKSKLLTQLKKNGGSSRMIISVSGSKRSIVNMYWHVNNDGKLSISLSNKNNTKDKGSTKVSFGPSDKYQLEIMPLDASKNQTPPPIAWFKISKRKSSANPQ
jgi:hypothetical protein